MRSHARMSGEQVEQLARQILALREKQLAELVEGYHLKDPRHQVHFKIGEARTVIPKLAAKESIDLIIMGTVCRTGLPGFFIGNTAEEVLHQVDCSVLVLKPEGFVSPVRLGDP